MSSLDLNKRLQNIIVGNFNGLHAGGPNCLLGASPQGGVDGQPPSTAKPSLKASSSKFLKAHCMIMPLHIG